MREKDDAIVNKKNKSFKYIIQYPRFISTYYSWGVDTKSNNKRWVCLALLLTNGQ